MENTAVIPQLTQWQSSYVQYVGQNMPINKRVRRFIREEMEKKNTNEEDLDRKWAIVELSEDAVQQKH